MFKYSYMLIFYRFFLQLHLQMESAEYFPPLLRSLTQSMLHVVVELSFFGFSLVLILVLYIIIIIAHALLRESRTGPSADSKFGEVQKISLVETQLFLMHLFIFDV